MLTEKSHDFRLMIFDFRLPDNVFQSAIENRQSKIVYINWQR